MSGEVIALELTEGIKWHTVIGSVQLFSAVCMHVRACMCPPLYICIRGDQKSTSITASQEPISGFLGKRLPGWWWWWHVPLILVLVRQELSVSLGPAWSVYSTVRAKQKKGKAGVCVCVCGVSCLLLDWNFSSRPGCMTSMLQGHIALVTAPRVMLPFLHGF